MITTWDCETTTRTSFKRKANPFDPGNWVVTHGFKRVGDAGVIRDGYNAEQANARRNGSR